MIALKGTEHIKKSPYTGQSNKGSQFHYLNDTSRIYTWQELVNHTQGLAINHPEIGLNHEVLPRLEPGQLMEVYFVLKHLLNKTRAR